MNRMAVMLWLPLASLPLLSSASAQGEADAPPPATPPPTQVPPPSAPPSPEGVRQPEEPAAAPGTAAEAEPPTASEGNATSASAPKDAAQDDAQKRLADVVVTAHKREEKAQDVSVAISVASGKQITEKNIRTSNEIERISPNLSGQVPGGGRSTRARWFLRGIGSNDPSVNLESPIGVYSDEVFIAYGPSQTFPLFDLERVEVLKGPQGTLWGKNTTGGAIHFVSKKPRFDPSGYVRGIYGSYGNRGLDFAYGGPVAGEWLAGRAAAYYEEQAGWATNLRDGSKDPQFNDFATRGQLFAVIGQHADVLLSARFRYLNGGNSISYPRGSLPGGEIRQYQTAATSYTPSYGADPKIGDPFFRGAGYSHSANSGATLTVNGYLSDYTLTSISAVDYGNVDSLGSTYWPDPKFDQTGSFSGVASRQISEELRLTSPKTDRFNWILGLHYFNWHLFSDSVAATFGPVASRKSYADNRLKQDDISYAAFASANFRVTDALAVSGGLRYTYDRKNLNLQRLNANGDALTFSDRSNWYQPANVSSELSDLRLARKKGWSQLTFDVTPELRVSHDALLFFRFAKGFRAGTFNPTIVPSTGQVPVANPEILYDWELGAKTTWFGGRLTANAAVFYYLLKDVQLNVQQPNPMGLPNATGSTVQNAAGGRIRGAELELDAVPIEGLHLNGGLGLIHTEYTDFVTFQGNSTVDASGNAFYRTPSVSAVAGVEYTYRLNENWSLGAGTDWLYRSRIYHNAVIQNDPVQETPPYVLGNAEFKVITNKGRLTLQAYVRNLADKSYKVLSTVVSSGAYPTSLGIPRTYGLQLIATF